jgi:uncharacterized membrane protein
MVGTKRIEALADGVFAIVMTLLVLELAVPHLAEPSTSDALLKELLGLRPKVIVYVLSFTVLGFFWTFHHRQLDLIVRNNGMFLWANIFFLMVVALIPFSTSLIGDYPTNRVAIIVYGSNFFVACQVLLLQWTYAAGRQRLVDPGLPKNTVRRIKIGLVVESLGIVAAVALSIIDTRLSLGVFALITLLSLLYIMTRRYSTGDFPGSNNELCDPAPSRDDSCCGENRANRRTTE